METLPAEKKELAKRPEPMKNPFGQKIGLVSNCFEIALKNPGIIYTYAVAFNPEMQEDSCRIKKKIISTFVKKGKLSSFYPFVFNGTNLFSLKKISEILIIKEQVEDSLYEIKVSLANSFELKNIAAYDSNPKIAIQAKSALNIIVKRLLESCSYIKLNRGGKYVSLRKSNTFTENLEVAPGCKATVTYVNSKLLLNVDVVTRVINTKTVAQYLSEIKADFPPSDNKGFKKYAKVHLKFRTVLTRYGDCKSYLIDKIDFKHNPNDEYIDTPYQLKQQYPKLADKINLVDYYKLAYNISFKNTDNPPLLISKYKIIDPETRQQKTLDKRVRKLIPELCFLTGLEDEIREDHKMMQELSFYTKKSPTDRINLIKALVNELTSSTVVSKKGEKNNNKILEDFGLEIKNIPINVNERIFNDQNIILDTSQKSIIKSSNGVYKLESNILDPITLDEWILIYTQRNQEFAQCFVDTLIKSAKTFGIHVDNPLESKVYERNAEAYLKAAYSAIQKVKNPKIIVFITENKEIYKEIKKDFIYHDSILNQIVLGNTLRKGKGLISICSNIILQINAKMNKPLINIKFEDKFPPMMVMGIDIRRSKDKDKNVKYILGCSSSTDLGLSKYYSQYKFVRPQKEPLSTGYCKFILPALKKYAEQNKNELPKIIIIYRSGISESQIWDDYFIEVETLHKELQNKEIQALSKDYDPRFLYCIVNEKSNGLRLFSKENITENRSNKRGNYSKNEEWKNPPAGTLIYNDIVDEKHFEFYLQPQYVSSGTATPVHFQVLYTNSKVNLEIFANLTNSLCYMYPNWRGAIKLPACLKLSKKMLDLVSKISNHPNNFSGDFNEALFYL